MGQLLIGIALFAPSAILMGFALNEARKELKPCSQS